MKTFYENNRTNNNNNNQNQHIQNSITSFNHFIPNEFLYNNHYNKNTVTNKQINNPEEYIESDTLMNKTSNNTNSNNKHFDLNFFVNKKSSKSQTKKSSENKNEKSSENGKVEKSEEIEQPSNEIFKSPPKENFYTSSINFTVQLKDPESQKKQIKEEIKKHFKLIKDELDAITKISIYFHESNTSSPQLLSSLKKSTESKKETYLNPPGAYPIFNA